jgi:hypothetical protein
MEARAEGRILMTEPAHAPAITFGMHVMTATHAMRSPVTAAASVGVPHGSSPPRPSPARHVHAAQDGAGAETVQCTDSNEFTSMQSMTAACTPSAKTATLVAPLPGTGIIARNTNAGTQSTISALWSYLPGSRSPGELCIGRTQNGAGAVT